MLKVLFKGKGNIKVKAKLSLCLNQHHATKTYGGSGGIPLHIFNLRTRGR